jgi:hypothetical protein
MLKYRIPTIIERITLLEIIDPSDWIKNTQSVVASKSMPHRIAMSFWDDDYESLSAGIQAFNFNTAIASANPIDEDFLLAIQDATLNIMESSLRKHPEVTCISILSVHDEMEVALSILQAIMKIPTFVNLKIIAAIATDNKNWIDVLLVRTGLVDLETITVFEMNQIVGENDLNIFEINSQEEFSDFLLDDEDENDK